MIFLRAGTRDFRKVEAWPALWRNAPGRDHPGWLVGTVAGAGGRRRPAGARRRRSRTAAPPAAAAPASAVIRSISVRGNQRLEPATIISYASLAPGQTYTAATLDQALKDLYATELFTDVVITGAETGAIVITVRESPVINRIVLEGNKRLKSDKILPEIKLAPRQIFTRSKVRADVERIVELYKREGRFARPGRAQDRPARPEPRRPRVRDLRRRQVEDPKHQRHRQPGVRRRPPAQGNVLAPGRRRCSASSSPTTAMTPTGSPPTSRSCAPST